MENMIYRAGIYCRLSSLARMFFHVWSIAEEEGMFADGKIEWPSFPEMHETDMKNGGTIQIIST